MSSPTPRFMPYPDFRDPNFPELRTRWLEHQAQLEGEEELDPLPPPERDRFTDKEEYDFGFDNYNPDDLPD